MQRNEEPIFQQATRRSANSTNLAPGWLLHLLTEMDRHISSFPTQLEEVLKVVDDVQLLYKIGKHARSASADDDHDASYVNQAAADTVQSHLFSSGICECENTCTDTLISDPSFCLKEYCKDFIGILNKLKALGDILDKDKNISTCVSFCDSISDILHRMHSISER